MVGMDERAPRRRVRTAAAFALVTTGVVAVLATYTSSLLTGSLSDSVVMPVGAATFVFAVVLCVRAPHRYGLGLGKTREHMVLIG